MFFGNFKDLKLADYKKAMTVISSNVEAIHHAIIEDIFYLGKALAQKPLYLKHSLYILVGGICVALIMHLFSVLYMSICL